MSKLATEFQLKSGVLLKNRILMAPMTTQMSFSNGVITTDEQVYYQNRSGEIGAVITGAANVQAIGQGWEGELGVFDDKFIPRLSELATGIQQNGTKAFLQIFHAGRMTNSAVLRGKQPVSASGIPAERPDAETPRELSEKEILALIDDFKKTTLRAIKAGFDGIEIHGANTYIIQQFFSPHSNRRTDDWGGSLEKRFHFIDCLVDEILAVVKEHAETPFAVGYRFSPEEYENPGIRMNDTLYLVDQLAQKELDYLHISLNDYTRVSAEKEFQQQTILEIISERLAGKIPLVGVGNVRTSKDAETVLKKAELVAVGQALILDPHWGKKVLAKEDSTIRTADALKEPVTMATAHSLWDFVQLSRPKDERK